MSGNEKTAELLRSRGLRATSERIKLLAYLRNSNKPLRAEELRARLKCDLVTVYRNLQAFVAADLARIVRLRKATALYEFAHGEHHHHLVCTGCGIIAELPECTDGDIDRGVLKNARDFASVDEHSLEFFGVCNTCAEA